MRRHRSSPRRRFPGAVWALAALLSALPLTGHAQGGLSQEGALFLLVPVGARAVGMGQAVSASELGSEAIWWNPASLARMTKSEAAVNHSVALAGITGDAVEVVFPAGRAGVLAAAAYLFNPGAQEITDQYGTTVGMLYPRSIVAAASYAATFGSRVSAGVTYKYVQEALGCSGTCTLPSSPASTSAFDFGVQAIVDDPKRLTLALAVRNLGFPLQVIDAPQADPLPTRVHLGAQYTLPGVERVVADGALRVSAELVDKLAVGDPSLHVGGEFAYKGQVFLRAGFVNNGSGVEGRTAIGLGVQRGGISMDFARAFGGISSDQGAPPTYVTLRFRF